jgi:hypothetical protein
MGRIDSEWRPTVGRRRALPIFAALFASSPVPWMPSGRRCQFSWTAASGGVPTSRPVAFMRTRQTNNTVAFMVGWIKQG